MTDMINQAINAVEKLFPSVAKTIRENPMELRKVTQAYEKSAHDKSGLLNLIDIFGGESIINDIESGLNKNPKAKFIVNGLLGQQGTSIKQLKAELKSNQGEKQSYIRSDLSNQYRDRLAKLK